jgi:hypothetical protein
MTLACRSLVLLAVASMAIAAPASAAPEGS